MLTVLSRQPHGATNCTNIEATRGGGGLRQQSVVQYNSRRMTVWLHEERSSYSLTGLPISARCSRLKGSRSKNSMVRLLRSGTRRVVYQPSIPTLFRTGCTAHILRRRLDASTAPSLLTLDGVRVEEMQSWQARRFISTVTKGKPAWSTTKNATSRQFGENFTVEGPPDSRTQLRLEIFFPSASQ